LEKKKKKICIYSLQTGYLKAEQNDRKVKIIKIKKKEKGENSKYKRLLPRGGEISKMFTCPRTSGLKKHLSVPMHYSPVRSLINTNTFIST